MARLSRGRQSAQRGSLAAPGEAPGSDARLLPTLTGHLVTSSLEPSQQRGPPGKGQEQHEPGGHRCGRPLVMQPPARLGDGECLEGQGQQVLEMQSLDLPHGLL